MTNADAEVELAIIYKELSWNLLSFPPTAKLRCNAPVALFQCWLLIGQAAVSTTRRHSGRDVSSGSDSEKLTHGGQTASRSAKLETGFG